MEIKTLKQKVLAFLHEQLEANKIPHIRKGMVEDFEKFIQGLLAEQQTNRAADKMIAQKQESEEPLTKALASEDISESNS